MVVENRGVLLIFWLIFMVITNIAASVLFLRWHVLGSSNVGIEAVLGIQNATFPVETSIQLRANLERVLCLGVPHFFTILFAYGWGDDAEIMFLIVAEILVITNVLSAVAIWERKKWGQYLFLISATIGIIPCLGPTIYTLLEFAGVTIFYLLVRRKSGYFFPYSPNTITV